MDAISKYDLINISKNEFEKQFSIGGDSVALAPGRINFIGEHTDYNLGLAMPIAINRWICTVIRKRNDRIINIYSSNFQENICTNLDNLKSNKLWKKYILGCIQIIKDRFNIQTGIDVLIKGNIPIGFGFSSSAALEISLLGALFSIYNLKINYRLILKLSNEVENNYIGIKSGMLDQYTSLFSKRYTPLVIDFYTLNHTYTNMNIKNGTWVIINSMVDRKLIKSKYNDRVNECSRGLKKINKFSGKSMMMNEITLQDLKIIKDDIVLYNRLYHVVSENKRVISMQKSLDEGNLYDIGNILNQSHESLSKYYDVSCSEIESIIKISNNQKGFYGGRIMGGGFGGCTISLVETSKKDIFIENVISSFFNEYHYKIKVESVDFSDGLEVF